MGRWIGPVGVVAAAVAALFLPMRESLAWGLQGHRVIALIALQQSDPAVRAKILAILATDKGKGLTKNDIASAVFVDTSSTAIFKKQSENYKQLRSIHGNFGDERVARDVHAFQADSVQPPAEPRTQFRGRDAAS